MFIEQVFAFHYLNFEVGFYLKYLLKLSYYNVSDTSIESALGTLAMGS